MAEKKRKSKEESGGGRLQKKRKNSKPKTLKKRTGPRLPSKLRKELDLVNPNPLKGGFDEEINSDEGELLANNLYEYEEAAPEEESKKNRRFDSVENFEYELPEDFKDENIASDDDDIEGEDEENNRSENSSHLGDEVEEEDDGRHMRMLQGITGMPSEAFEGKKRKNNVVVSEAYPESEYNPSRDVLEGNGRISIQDLLDPLHGKSGYSKLRKRMHQVERKSMSVHAPLPKADREKLERKVAYEQSKKDITKWEPLVKKNREAPTVYFDEDLDLGFSTVGAIASEFEPRTDFEKKIASLVHDDKVLEAHRQDGSRLLELNKISVEDVKERHNRIAKMRSLLFNHEMKAKRIKKIKSKTYHRLLKKDRLKTASAEIQMDPEAAKELAMKQEFKRAEERLTLKHKNSSKWAKRILKRGLDVQDEGTRAAITEQLHQHALLTRKMHSMKDISSDESSDDDDFDENSAGSDEDGASKLLAKAKEKTLEVLEEEDKIPDSGVLSLPFMVRGLKKRKEAAYEEGKLAINEFEASLKQMELGSGAENLKETASSGRRVFGTVKKQIQEFSNKDAHYNNSDSEDEFKVKENIEAANDQNNNLPKHVDIDAGLLREESEIGQDPIFKSFDDIVRDPGPKTTHEVAMFASGSWKKMKSENEANGNIIKPPKSVEPPRHNKDQGEVGGDSDTDDEGQMVDGTLSSGMKATYELPSQAELIRRAFAGDDVEEDFEKDKEEILKGENPEPEKPVLLPGWGQWTHVQQKKGLPSWMLEEHEIAKKKREEALKKRKDAHLKHVIVSEKLDKKVPIWMQGISVLRETNLIMAGLFFRSEELRQLDKIKQLLSHEAEKLHTKTLPFPYTSKEVFEQSIRMPIGPEFNPAVVLGALNRPEVVKKAGVIIKPIKYKDVNPHEGVEEHGQGGKKQNTKKSKGVGGKTIKKTNNLKR